MSTDLVSEFLKELKKAEPASGYMSVEDEPTAAPGEPYRDTVSIDGWLHRSELDGILRGIYQAGRESAARDIEAEAAECEAQFPGGKTSAVMVEAARIIRGTSLTER